MAPTDSDRWRPHRPFLWLLIVLALVNIPLTIHFLLPRPWTHSPEMSLAGPAAAARGWPATTPHRAPWPAPSGFSIERHAGRALVQAWLIQEGPPEFSLPRLTHRVRDERYGWPLACLRRTEFFWPDNQQWRLNAPWESGLRLAWGAFLNPVIVVAGAWAAFTAPRILLERRRARRRAKRGCCTRCGYPRGVSPVCTECGAAVRAGPGEAYAISTATSSRAGGDQSERSGKTAR